MTAGAPFFRKWSSRCAAGCGRRPTSSWKSLTGSRDWRTKSAHVLEASKRAAAVATRMSSGSSSLVPGAHSFARGFSLQAPDVVGLSSMVFTPSVGSVLQDAGLSSLGRRSRCGLKGDDVSSGVASAQVASSSCGVGSEVSSCGDFDGGSMVSAPGSGNSGSTGWRRGVCVYSPSSLC
jgi:hypothetical protein